MSLPPPSPVGGRETWLAVLRYQNHEASSGKQLAAIWSVAYERQGV